MRTSNPRLQAAEKAFLEAMRRGYAGGIVPMKDGHSRFYTLEIDGFTIEDYWELSPMGTDRSCGKTDIVQEGELIWRMSYAGWYPKKVIPFLMQALVQNYAANVFNGGRGPETFELPGSPYRYRNFVVGDFACGHGCETVNDYVNVDPTSASALIGKHYYHCLALI